MADPEPLVIDQVPPIVASVKAGVVEPAHTVGEPPPITAATALTVREVEVVDVPQPLVLLKLMLVIPGPTAVTRPDEFTVAIKLLPVLQVPPILLPLTVYCTVDEHKRKIDQIWSLHLVAH